MGVRRIGVLLRVAEDDPDAQRDLKSFREGLQQFGWAVGSNLQIEYRYASAEPAQMRVYASELVSLPAEVILAGGSLAVTALRRETRSIPIVFVRVADPLSQGFVASLAHPDGNVTGFTSFDYPMVGKWLEFLKELTPRLVRVAFMFDPETDPYGPGYLHTFETVAPLFAVQAIAMPVQDLAGVERAVAALGQEPGSSLIVVPGAFTDVYREQIIGLVAHHRIPSVYAYRYFTAAGGLISYGVDSADIYRRAAAYVDRILKDEKPADLPVQQPTKFELVINLKTAKALGLTVPLAMQMTADEVIE